MRRRTRVLAVRDFLPSPEESALWEDTVKVTLQVARSGIDFLKQKRLSIILPASA